MKNITYCFVVLLAMYSVGAYAKLTECRLAIPYKNWDSCQISTNGAYEWQLDCTGQWGDPKSYPYGTAYPQEPFAVRGQAMCSNFAPDNQGYENINGQSVMVRYYSGGPMWPGRYNGTDLHCYCRRINNRQVGTSFEGWLWLGQIAQYDGCFATCAQKCAEKTKAEASMRYLMGIAEGDSNIKPDGDVDSSCSVSGRPGVAWNFYKQITYPELNLGGMPTLESAGHTIIVPPAAPNVNSGVPHAATLLPCRRVWGLCGNFEHTASECFGTPLRPATETMYAKHCYLYAARGQSLYDDTGEYTYTVNCPLDSEPYDMSYTW